MVMHIPKVVCPIILMYPNTYSLKDREERASSFFLIVSVPALLIYMYCLGSRCSVSTSSNKNSSITTQSKDFKFSFLGPDPLKN